MKTKCEHRQFKFSCQYDVECAECGDRVVLNVHDEDDAEVYFEISWCVVTKSFHVAKYIPSFHVLHHFWANNAIVNSTNPLFAYE